MRVVVGSSAVEWALVAELVVLFLLYFRKGISSHSLKENRLVKSTVDYFNSITLIYGNWR